MTLLAYAANEAYRNGLFNPEGANKQPLDVRESVLFDAPLGSIPMRVWISDWRLDEIRIVAAAWPTAEVDRWIEAAGARELAGEMVATGRLTRGPTLRFVTPLDPNIFISESRQLFARSLCAPSRSEDFLCLYPLCLSYDSGLMQNNRTVRDS
jgi:hypothetical protein